MMEDSKTIYTVQPSPLPTSSCSFPGFTWNNPCDDLWNLSRLSTSVNGHPHAGVILNNIACLRRNEDGTYKGHTDFLDNVYSFGSPVAKEDWNSSEYKIGLLTALNEFEEIIANVINQTFSFAIHNHLVLPDKALVEVIGVYPNKKYIKPLPEGLYRIKLCLNGNIPVYTFKKKTGTKQLLTILKSQLKLYVDEPSVIASADRLQLVELL